MSPTRLALFFALIVASVARSSAALADESAAKVVMRTSDQSGIESTCAAGKPIHVGGGEIIPEFDLSAYSAGSVPLCAWIARAALAVRGYYGRYPVEQVRLLLKPVDGGGVRGGTTYGESDDGRPLIVIPLGREVTPAQLTDDWTLTHEMVHLSVPSVPRRSHWLEEGIATYVEPIARVQRGELSAQRIWADMMHDMRKGLPGNGDEGLDRTPSWGRTYWGGALFCLIADVEIHQRTGNKKGLQDALRGVLAAGGSIRTDSFTEHVFEVGDRATGVPVLGELYRRMGDAPGPDAQELAQLWQALGVQADGDSVRFDDSAPLAAVRRAITAPRVDS